MNEETKPLKEEAEKEESLTASPFEQFGLDPAILRALKKMDFKEPSDIQLQTIPLIQEKKDLIALAQTGSGKTAACAIPVCNRVDVKRTHVQALIVVPTRELALQYATEAQKIGVYKGVKAFAIYGGESAAMQQSKLKHGVQVLVATPGRLIDFIHSRQIDLSHVETLILDEADEMLSMGFFDDLEFIIQCLVHDHQTLLFSATMPNAIRNIGKAYMKNPSEVVLTTKKASPDSIEHQFVYCHHDERDKFLVELINNIKPGQSIIFCHSRFQVEKVCKALQHRFDGVDFLHAGLNQDVRSSVTNKFRSGKIKFLVATDVVARGLDFSNVSHVFIYQLSADPDIYVHRSGRTGRFDRTGVVISFVTPRELSHLDQILAQIDRKAIWLGDPPPATSEQRRSPPAKRRYPPR